MKIRRSFVTAAAVGALSVATAGAALAAPGVTAERLFGADRWETSRAIANDTFDTSTVAIVANGLSFADALAASYLAGASDAPIVLTEGGTLTPAAMGTLTDLEVDGVIIVGGTNAVSADVAGQIAAMGIVVDRLGGADRWSTAQIVAESVPEEAIGSLVADIGRTAILVSGMNFPDALSAGPVAYDAGFPLLLTHPDALSAQAAAAIDELDIEHVVIVGGVEAVSEAVEAQVSGLGIDVLRVYGDDRSETAREVADLAVDQLGFSTTHVNLARGDSFADALAGAPNAGAVRSAILLTQTRVELGAASRMWLETHAETLTSINVYGGTTAISDETVDAALDAAGRTP